MGSGVIKRFFTFYETFTIRESGMLRGRPFGGVIILIKSTLRKITKTIHCCDRYIIVKVGDCIFVNIYLPCSGTRIVSQSVMMS